MASTSTAVEAPQPADPSKPAGPQAEVADTDVEMQDADKDASDPSSSDSKYKGELTGMTSVLEVHVPEEMSCVSRCSCSITLLFCIGIVFNLFAQALFSTLQVSTSFVVS